MTDLERWLDANDRFLAASVASLRERLERLAMASRPEPPAAPVVPTPPPARTAPTSVAAAAPVAATPVGRTRSLFDRLRGVAPAPAVSGTLQLPRLAADPITDHAPASQTTPETQPVVTPADPPPALTLLARRLGLSDFESQILLLCAAMELDTRIASLCARALQDASRPYPTFALALRLFEQPAWDAMSPDRPLRYWRLIEINQPGVQPLVNSALKADERIVNYLKGLNYLDDRLAPLVTPIPRDATPLPLSQQTVSDAIADYLARAKETSQTPVLQLLGSDSHSKQLIAERASARLGLLPHRVSAESLPTQSTDLESFVRLWQRESALLPLALYIDTTELDRTTGPVVSALQRVCKRGMGVIFVDTRQQWADLGRGSLAVDIARPTPAEQHAAWTEALGGQATETSQRLAAQFNFNLPVIQSIAAGARLRVSGDADRLGDAVWSDCLQHARPALDQLAQPLDPKARWDDLELPPAEKSLLHQIAQQVRARLAVYDTWGFRERMNRGLGISVLCAGESGTGKTMAAEVLANDLSLMLYRIDLSSVVSKYIGETERNLRKLFDAAEDGGAILFFDEADALFGKRSEVKDSHDRYANIEINYLLQRMESYRGLAILATNMKSALDTAFLRRLRFIVNFPFPGPSERLAIWQKVFPAKAPIDGVDFARLARFNITGGSIHNIALNAAFLAAHAGEAITMPIVLEAVRNEYRKLDKPINEADFRWLQAKAAGA
jgi:hypothetical protein